MRWQRDATHADNGRAAPTVQWGPVLVEYQLLRFVRGQLDAFASMRLTGPLSDADWLEATEDHRRAEY